MNDQPHQRLDWIDIARGIGIILVVYGHALRGLVTAGILPNSGWAVLHDTVIYAFHMPLFFFLAGLTVVRGLSKGRRGFLEDKLAFVVWPYFLWSMIHGGLKLVASPYVNTSLSVDDLMMIPFRPIEHFWFLYCLFFCQIIVLIFSGRLNLLVVAAICGIYLWFYGIFAGSVANQISYNLAFLVAGMIVSPFASKFRDRKIWSGVFLCGGTIGFIAIFLYFGPTVTLAVYPLALLGTAGVIGGSLALRRGTVAMTLAFLGRLSMPIYLIHTIASAGTRALFSGTGVNSLILLLIVTLVGIVLPLLVYFGAARLNLTRVLGLGGSGKVGSQVHPPQPPSKITTSV